MIRLTAILMPVLLAGCAGQSAMRSTSGQSAAMLTQYRQSFGEFAAGQSALNAANQERLDNLASITRGYQSEIDLRLQLWDAIDAKDATAKLKAYGAVHADDILAVGGQVNPQPAAAPQAALKFETAQVDTVVKKLLALQKKPSLGDRFGDVISFTGALRTSYDAAVAKAAEDAAGTTAAAGSATAEAVPATKTP